MKERCQLLKTQILFLFYNYITGVILAVFLIKRRVHKLKNKCGTNLNGPVSEHLAFFLSHCTEIGISLCFQRVVNLECLVKGYN